ncbi:unnamed protein product [Clavelina lepadiformis]|uniref:Uncharacterized protein n=1 Tax=Clavelina lepadiformis TaxID=159417 RepID=A0ABP0GTN1_CLALP
MPNFRYFIFHLFLTCYLQFTAAQKKCTGVDQEWCGSFSRFCTQRDYKSIMEDNCPALCGLCISESDDPRCTTDNGGCEHICNINEDTVMCTCHPGYELVPNGKNCSDINECLFSDACPEPHIPYCVNEVGGYFCSNYSCTERPGFFNKYQSSECCAAVEETSCGSDSLTSGRIVGGRSAKVGGWPWMVYVLIDSSFICGGTLIDENWVITAAHCFRSTGINSTVETFFGRLNPSATKREEPHVQQRTVTQIILHPDWEKDRFPYHDIALLRLSSPVMQGAFIKTVCLPNGEVPSPNTRCWVTGFGTTAYRGPAAKDLQEVGLPIVDIQRCKRAYEGTQYPVDENLMICAGYASGGKDACQGDSGGPLVCQRCDSCSWYLAGVVSFGKGCAEPQYFGVYTNVENHEQWISQETGVPVTKSRTCGRVVGARFSAWDQWTSCSESCFSGDGMPGQRSRSRVCLNENPPHEVCRGNTRQTENCNTDRCAYWGEYGAFSQCSVTCGEGIIKRERQCIGGDPGQAGCLGSAFMEMTCNERMCPVWNEWQKWSRCHIRNGVCERQSSRTCNTFGNVGVSCKGNAMRTETCNDDQCPHWGEWSDWDDCSEMCGGGVRSKSRSCINGNIKDVGCNVGEATIEELCNTDVCDQWSEWKPWSSCSKTCDGGRQSAMRECIGGTAGVGGCPGKNTRSRQCATMVCPFWSKWSKFGKCSKTCGGGTKTQTRTCENGNPGDSGCHMGTDRNTVQCNTQACPRWSDWDDWMECSVTCGGGTRHSTRECLNGVVGDVGCQGSKRRNDQCNSQKCPTWTAFSGWSKCSKTCGGGESTNSRTCLNGKPGDKGCAGMEQMTRTCNTNDCPYWQNWRKTGVCSTTCGKGQIEQTRTCHGGEAGQEGCIGGTTRMVECEITPCPVKWTDWSEYTPCSVTCGNGWKTRTRTCEGAVVGQKGCEGSAVQNITCGEICVPEWDNWNQWSTCSRTCYGGTQTRSRNCLNGQPGQPNCTPARKAVDTRVCNEQDCDECVDLQPTCLSWYCVTYRDYSLINCQKTCQFCSEPTDPWGRWSECTATCDGGIQFRNRTCLVPPCVSQIRACNVDECSGYTEWSEWSKCSLSCNGGSRTRTRYCPQNVECFPDDFGNRVSQTESCKEEKCPGTWSNWSKFGICSKTCGPGMKERTRQCNGGTVGGPGCIGAAKHQMMCSVRQCPAKWGDWVSDGSCSVSCGGGEKNERRSCIGGNPGSPGCSGNEVRNVRCNTLVCVTRWLDWGSWGECTTTSGGQQTTRRSRECENGSPGDPGCIEEANQSKSCNTNTGGQCAGLRDNLPPSRGTCQDFLFACQTHLNFSRNNCALTCCKATESDNAICEDTPAHKTTCEDNRILCNHPSYISFFESHCRKTCGFCNS